MWYRRLNFLFPTNKYDCVLTNFFVVPRLSLVSFIQWGESENETARPIRRKFRGNFLFFFSGFSRRRKKTPKKFFPLFFFLLLLLLLETSLFRPPFIFFFYFFFIVFHYFLYHCYLKKETPAIGPLIFVRYFARISFRSPNTTYGACCIKAISAFYTFQKNNCPMLKLNFLAQQYNNTQDHHTNGSPFFK